MRYHNITKDDMLNGDGLRVVLWVSGCDHCCKECHNPITWDPNGGLVFDEEAKEELFEELKKDYVSGITFSGGDPLYAGNREDVLKLAKDYVDVLVDGEFVKEEADPQLHWKGSANQRVIDVKATKKSGEVVLHCA